MDVLLWVLLIAVVIGAVWWFQARKPGETVGTSRGEFEHESPTMTQGLRDAAPQPPLVMDSSPESGLNRPLSEPDSVGDPASESPLAAENPNPSIRRDED